MGSHRVACVEPFGDENKLQFLVVTAATSDRLVCHSEVFRMPVERYCRLDEIGGKQISAGCAAGPALHSQKRSRLQNSEIRQAVLRPANVNLVFIAKPLHPLILIAEFP